MNQSQRMIESLYQVGEGYTLNVATTPLPKARAWAAKEFSKAGKDLDEMIPDFDANYQRLAKATRDSPDIPRVEMPVIEPEDMDRFRKDLAAGNIDLFKPLVFKEPFFPKNLLTNPKAASGWLKLGQKDGDPKDDVVKAKVGTTAAKQLKPIQGQIWLENIIGPILQFGLPSPKSPIAKTTLIISKDKFILDGHHRFGQAMLAMPDLKIKTLAVPIDIDLLLKMGRSYGNAMGRQQKQ
jgi:hypothetical protein